MEPPVASDISTTVATIESLETTILPLHIVMPQNLSQKIISVGEEPVDELRNSTSPASVGRLRDQFRTILLSLKSAVKDGLLADQSSTYTDSEYSSYLTAGINSRSDVNFIPDETIQDLRCIADRMIKSGYSRECIQVYASVRKAAMDESFQKLGVEKLSSKNLQRLEWNIQQEKIRRWIRNAEICFRMLFANEKRLSEQIFEGLGTDIDGVCFMETVKDYAALLFNFVEAISTSRKSLEKLFRILDLYKVLSDLLADIKMIFQPKSGEFIRKKAVEILFSLSDAARGMLSEFEMAVFGESTKVLVSGGSIHPLTKCVMNYIDSMADYKQTLIELIVSKPSTYSSELDLEIPEIGRASPMMLHLIWIAEILKFNLKAKSRHYKDASLAHFFMMNNVQYIFQKIQRSTELREMIGDDYLNKLIEEYHLAASHYLKISWKRASDCLRDDGLQKLGSFLSGTVSKLVLRQRFKAFNAKFEKVLKTQATWFVNDTDLREELKFSILQILIPVYTSFLKRHGSHISRGKQPENYIRYSAEDVETAVMNLFEGY